MTTTHLRQAKIEAVLSKKYNYSGFGILTRKEFIEKTHKAGARVEQGETPSVKYNRVKYNRMDWQEQQEYEKKLNTMVPDYRLYQKGETWFTEITKIEYDYFLSLTDTPELLPGMEYASKAELNHLFGLNP